MWTDRRARAGGAVERGFRATDPDEPNRVVLRRRARASRRALQRFRRRHMLRSRHILTMLARAPLWVRLLDKMPRSSVVVAVVIRIGCLAFVV